MYNNQLIAIRGMLNNNDKEIIREGYDLLFKLWRENLDTVDFTQELTQIAIEHEQLVQEFKTRINELSLTDSITDTFLSEKLDALTCEISMHKSNKEDIKEESIKENTTGENKRVEMQKSRLGAIKRLLTIIVLLFVVFIIVINFLYVLPTEEGTISTDLPGIQLSYKSPTFLSLRDENTLDVSVNNTMLEEYEGRITLVFVDPDFVIKPTLNQKFSADLDVHSHDKEPKQFKFFLSRKPSYNEIIYHFEFSSSNDTLYQSANKMLLIAPVPYIRSASSWIITTLVAVIVALVGDQLKKAATSTLEKFSNLFKIPRK
jgi:hypothetical protein